MGGDWILWLGCAVAVAGVAILRAAWALPKRSVPLTSAGWVALLLGSMLAAAAAGAWGLTVAALAAMAAACVFLAQASFEAPRWKRQPSSRTAASATAGEPATGAWSRSLTFVLAGPLALAASLAVSLALRQLTLAAGAPEADGNVAVLALLPLVWAALAAWLLMMDSRARQGRWLFGLTAGAVAVCLFSGGFG